MNKYMSDEYREAALTKGVRKLIGILSLAILFLLGIGEWV